MVADLTHHPIQRNVAIRYPALLCGTGELRIRKVGDAGRGLGEWTEPDRPASWLKEVVRPGW